jgi:hypothetical protein
MGGVTVAPLVVFSAVLRFLRRGVVGLVSGFATAEAAGAGAGLLRDGFVVFTFCGRFLGAGAFALGVSFSAASFDVLVLVDTRADRLRVVVDMLQRVNWRHLATLSEREGGLWNVVSVLLVSKFLKSGFHAEA